MSLEEKDGKEKNKYSLCIVSELNGISFLSTELTERILLLQLFNVNDFLTQPPLFRLLENKIK